MGATGDAEQPRGPSGAERGGLELGDAGAAGQLVLTNPWNIMIKHRQVQRRGRRSQMTTSFTDPAISMDLLRAVLQPSINEEIQTVFNKYMKFFQKAALNVRDNVGEEVDTEQLIQEACRSCLEQMSGDKGISAFPESDNLFKWVGTIHGAAGTVYEDLRYKLSLEFPSGYPYNAPTVKFLTPCYHPNVDTQGNICLDILKDKWSALYDVRTILLSIQSLLGEPNIDSPLNTHAAELWKNPTAPTASPGIPEGAPGGASRDGALDRNP
ncbi:hypothetical protein H8959_022618 [Pygathrix nigripes]